MITTQTPFRMSFFGGGTDFPDFYNEFGGSVISTTFDKYCYVTVRHLPRFFNYSNQITYSKIEKTNTIDEIEHPAIREAMRFQNMNELHVVYDADLPARSGLGTSSSFAVGLLNAFHALKGEYVSKTDLSNEAIYLERTLCNEVGGVQDQIAAAFGGFNKISFSSSGFDIEPIIISEKRKNTLNNNLMLFFTGFSRFAGEVSVEQKNNIKKSTDRLKEMLCLVDEAEKILTNRDTPLEDFGRLLDYTWQLKRGLSSKISSTSIDEIYKKGIEAGATGGKLLGAGNGGFLVFYVEQEHQERVKEKLSDLLYVPFKFENEGTKILYYKPENYDFKKGLMDF